MTPTAPFLPGLILPPRATTSPPGFHRYRRRLLPHKPTERRQLNLVWQENLQFRTPLGRLQRPALRVQGDSVA